MSPAEMEAYVRTNFPDSTHFAFFHAPILRGLLATVASTNEEALENLHVRGSGPCEVYKLLTESGITQVWP